MQHQNAAGDGKQVSAVMAQPADLLFCFCFLSFSLVSASQDQQEITARPGQDVPLQCQGPRDASVKLLEWNRPDLKSDGYVFFYRNERSYENYQLPSFRGRVELSDPEMKGGDFSVVLKNVTTNDSGTYECRAMIVTLNETTPSEIRNLVPLTVTDADHTAAKIWAGGNTAGGNTAGGNTHRRLGVVVCLSVVGVLLVVGVCTGCIFRRRKGLKECDSYKPPAEKRLT